VAGIAVQLFRRELPGRNGDQLRAVCRGPGPLSGDQSWKERSLAVPTRISPKTVTRAWWAADTDEALRPQGRGQNAVHRHVFIRSISIMKIAAVFQGTVDDRACSFTTKLLDELMGDPGTVGTWYIPCGLRRGRERCDCARQQGFLRTPPRGARRNGAAFQMSLHQYVWET